MAENVLVDHGFQGDAYAVFAGCKTREEVYDVQTRIMEEMGFGGQLI